MLVDRLGEGRVVGCPALFPPYTYRRTVRSLTEIEVLKIDTVGLQDLIEKDCAFHLLVQQHINQILLDQIVDLKLSS